MQNTAKPVKAAARPMNIALFTAPLTALLIASAASTALAMGPNPAEPTFSEDAQFIPADLPAGHSFGQHVSLDNGLFSVGATFYDDEGSEFSTAYSFKVSNPEGGFELAPDKNETVSTIGPRSVIKDGILATRVIASPENNYTRSVYLYNAADGTLLHKLSPDDLVPTNGFGRSMDIDDGVLAVGAYYDHENGEYSGSVYLYDVHTGALLRKITADDGLPSDYFGISVALDNGLLAVGASGRDTLGASSGTIYLFDVATGAQVHTFLAEDGRLNGKLGLRIAMDDGVIASGASNDWDNGSYAGAMYLFDATTGEQIAKVYPENPRSYDYFGSALAMDDGIVAVGAEGYEVNKQNRVGSAYLFDANTGQQLAQLLPSDPANSFFFGDSIDLDGPELIVGSYGPVYFYNVNTIICPADLTGDRLIDFFDVSVFIDGFADQLAIADFTNDGEFDFFDVSAFLDHFAAGCPE